MSLTKSICHQTTNHLSLATGCNHTLYPPHHHAHHHSNAPSNSASNVNTFVLNHTTNNQAKDSIFSDEDLLRITKHIASSKRTASNQRQRDLHQTSRLPLMHREQADNTQHHTDNTHKNSEHLIQHHKHNCSSLHAQNHECKQNELAHTVPSSPSLLRSQSVQQHQQRQQMTTDPSSEQHSWPLFTAPTPVTTMATPSSLSNVHDSNQYQLERDSTPTSNIDNVSVIAGGLSIHNIAQFGHHHHHFDDEQPHHSQQSEQTNVAPIKLKFSPWQDTNDWNCVHIKL